MSKLLRALGPAGLAAIAYCYVALAQPARKNDYVPEVGQIGKDVVWVPTPDALVERMLDLARIKPGETLIDLGSGDGRLVIASAKRGVRALGIEYNSDLVQLSRRSAADQGVAHSATFEAADIFASDFSKADVITMFLLTDINIQLRPKILALRPGTRIVSNSFDMGDWVPEETAVLKEGCTRWCRALLWIVPAKVEGRWRLPHGVLDLKQRFQMIAGTLTADGKRTTVYGRLTGDQITFAGGAVSYTGTVTGATMTIIDGAGGPAVQGRKD